ncbi:MAG TPA: hypothetical protein VGH29_01810 [Candidatus Binataceae bacterium]
MGLVKDEILPVDKSAHTRPNVEALTEAGISGQTSSFGFDRIIQPFRRHWIIQSDHQVDFEQVFMCLATPDYSSGHPLPLS